MRPAPAAALAFLALALLTSCETAPAGGPRAARPADHAPAWISVERVHGGRAVYLVTVFDNGRAVLEGYFGGRQRTFSKAIPIAQASLIFGRIEAIDFWQREPRYDVEYIRRGADSTIGRIAPEDAPIDVLRAQRQSRLKRIDNLHFAPSELTELKALIEETVGLRAWLAEANRS